MRVGRSLVSSLYQPYYRQLWEQNYAAYVASQSKVTRAMHGTHAGLVTLCLDARVQVIARWPSTGL